MKKGRIVSVNTSKERGEKKNNIGVARVTKGKGIEGDGHFGFMHRQISLLSVESIERMKTLGLEVGPGDFAENLTVEGLDLGSVAVGRKIKVGSSVILRVTQIGKECHERCSIYYQAGECIMPKEGVFAEVVEEGEIRVGDEVEILE